MIYRIALLLSILALSIPALASNPWDPREHRQLENKDDLTPLDHESLSEGALTQEEQQTQEEHRETE